MKPLILTLALSFILTTKSYGANPAKQSADPQTIAESIEELKIIFVQLHIKFREGVTQEQIVFGLQHTLADQRQTDQGKKFPATPDYLPKVINYYKAMCKAILDNQSDVEIIPLYIEVLQDQSISQDESLYLITTEKNIQRKLQLDTRSFIKLENRDSHPTEVNTDPMLLLKDKDGMNEGLGFKMAGTDKIFMKQYLASLLEPIKK